MSVFHCPLCPLIFEFRTEVEYHLRNEHRSRAEEEARLAAEVAGADQDLDWARLRALQSSRAGLSVTILMATTPGPVMSNLDIARLRRLAGQARRRLASEARQVHANLEARLARSVVAAESYPTQEGLAILVSADELAIFRLPFEPTDRVVIDPTFATRDLYATLQRYPRYRILVLGRSPRLLEGRGMHLAEAGAEPAVEVGTVTGANRSPGGKRSGRPESWILGRARRAAGVELADKILADRIGSHGDLPLVVAGDGRWRSQFRRQSRHTASVIGEISGTRAKDAPASLAQLAQPYLHGRVEEEQAAAKAELERAQSHRSLAWGLQDVWASVQDSSADAVWVEQGFARPGRPAGGGATIEVVADPEQPGVIDDLVDDLIENSIRKGIGVHLLPAGMIGQPEPIASRKRSSTPTTGASVELARVR